MAFILYDVETTGLNRRFDQILQFAAVRTDADLVETERFETRSRLMPHVVPSPKALHVTGTSLDDANSMSRQSHYAMVCEIAKMLAVWCPATFLGFNSIRFDEEFLRQAFYQCLHPVFLTNTNGNRRTWANLEEKTFLRPLKNGFWYAWHKFGSRVEAVYAPIQDLVYWEQRFDVVMAGAFVCHLSDPVSAIGSLGRLANHAVIIAFEDVLDTDELTMCAANDWSNSTYDYTWWLLSRGLYRRLFANLGFRIEFVPCIAIHNQTNYNNLQTPTPLSKTTIIATRTT